MAGQFAQTMMPTPSNKTAALIKSGVTWWKTLRQGWASLGRLGMP
jgi:hypothetical protein